MALTKGITGGITGGIEAALADGEELFRGEAEHAPGGFARAEVAIHASRAEGQEGGVAIDLRVLDRDFGQPLEVEPIPGGVRVHLRGEEEAATLLRLLKLGTVAADESLRRRREKRWRELVED